MNAVIAPATASALAERVLIKGDLAGLSQAERMNYYQQVCHSLGLNPLTRPFEYITLNGKLTFYARKDATDQLRSVRGISTKILSKTIEDDIMVIHAAASDKEGRQDEDYGAVFIGSLKGEARANAIMKATTKAKRRVTLSICGLGWLDETEVSDLPADVAAPVDIDPETGELPPRQIDQDRAPPDNDEPAKLLGREAAARGKAILRVWTEGLDREVRARLKPFIMRELLPIADAVDEDGAKKRFDWGPAQSIKGQKKPEPETESRDEAGDQGRTDPAIVGGSSTGPTPSPSGELPIDDRDIFPPDRR